MHFTGKFSKGPWVQERVLLGLCICLGEYTWKVAASSPKELLQLYLVVQGRVQLEHSSYIVKLHANTSNADIYWRKGLNCWTHLELCHRNPDILKRVLNRITLSNSTMGKCAPMQVIKQPEHRRTSTTEEQNWSSFQTNYN